MEVMPQALFEEETIIDKSELTESDPSDVDVPEDDVVAKPVAEEKVEKAQLVLVDPAMCVPLKARVASCIHLFPTSSKRRALTLHRRLVHYLSNCFSSNTKLARNCKSWYKLMASTAITEDALMEMLTAILQMQFTVQESTSHNDKKWCDLIPDIETKHRPLNVALVLQLRVKSVGRGRNRIMVRLDPVPVDF